MTPPEREFALKELDGSRERLLGAMRELSRQQLEYKTASERWSVAECLEHIIVVEKFLLEGLQSLAQQAPDPSKCSDWKGRDEAFTKRIAGRERRVQASEAVCPTGRWPIENLLPEFEAIRARVREFAVTSPGDLRSCFGMHPVMGQIDGYQLLLNVAAHCDRHRVQGEEVIASAGFPR
jgi:DinB superfamily